jgi:hypothetical protein
MESDFYRTKPIYLATYGRSLDTFIGQSLQRIPVRRSQHSTHIRYRSFGHITTMITAIIQMGTRSSNFRAKLCIVDYLAGCVSSCKPLTR